MISADDRAFRETQWRRFTHPPCSQPTHPQHICRHEQSSPDRTGGRGPGDGWRAIRMKLATTRRRRADSPRR